MNWVIVTEIANSEKKKKNWFEAWILRTFLAMLISKGSMVTD